MFIRVLHDIRYDSIYGVVKVAAILVLLWNQSGSYRIVERCFSCILPNTANPNHAWSQTIHTSRVCRYLTPVAYHPHRPVKPNTIQMVAFSVPHGR